jgi:hypothetical protein
MKTRLQDFISAGFLVTREVDRPSYASAALLPKRLVSASACIAPSAPNFFCLTWTQDTPEERLQAAKAFSLDDQALSELTGWTTSRFDQTVRWPNVLTKLATAQELVNRFFSALPDIKILELGLHRSLTERFCQKAEPPAPEPGFAPTGRQGVHEVILEGKPPTRGGRVLGLEPLVFEYSLSCSWLCNGLETIIEQALGIKPNKHGLIEDYNDAKRCVEHISRDDIGAEPGLWLPWLIIDHKDRE